MFHRILVVCTGNVCRSPASEALLRQRLLRAGSQVEVQSAGVAALVGESADPLIRSRLLALGLDIETHRARQLEPEHARWSDLILVM
ncbi:MAG: low molecular weight protein arginine phosphatase, partial [Thiobacillaceae bacterium]|nr:low molecular weight protein arginine phosphatase [Thiobacillaceae bacterium]